MVDENASSSGAPRDDRDQDLEVTSASSSSSVSSEDQGVTNEKNSNISEWNGPNDPDNAQNWSLAKKWYHTLVITSFGFVATLASSIITPGSTQFTSEFNVGEEAGSIAFAIYVLGLAMGAPIASPLSETFGRKPVYLGLNILFALFMLGTGFANNIVALIFLRFFAGFFASPSLSCAVATVSDIWSPETRSTPMALCVAMPFLGPAMGPMIGGFVATNMGWRWTSWTLLFFYVAVCGPSLFMSETYKKAILARRARRLGREPAGAEEQKSWSQKLKQFLTSTMIRPLKMLADEPVVLWLCLFVAYIFAMQYSFYTAFPYVFQTYYDFDVQSVGLTFLGLATGTLLGMVGIILMNALVYKPMLRRAMASKGTAESSTSKVAPEHRLYPAMIGGPLITVSFFLFGWTTAYSIHWIVPLIAEAFFGSGNIMVFMSCSSYIMDTYGPLYGASAQAANSMLRYFLGFVFPLFARQMYEGMGVQWACTLLGCVSALGTCIPYLFFKFGPRMRAKTKYERGY